MDSDRQTNKLDKLRAGVMATVAMMADLSHCSKLKVGAVIMKDDRIVSTGYNGPPSGLPNCDETYGETGCARASDGSCSTAVHAEMNALVYAMKNKIDLKGSTLYCTMSPCLSCARLVYQAGVDAVLFERSYAEYKKLPLDEGQAFLRSVGVPCYQVEVRR